MFVSLSLSLSPSSNKIPLRLSIDKKCKKIRPRARGINLRTKDGESVVRNIIDHAITGWLLITLAGISSRLSKRVSPRHDFSVKPWAIVCQHSY